MKKLLLLLAVAALASGCVVTNLTTGERYECGVYPEDRMVHCVPLLPAGNFPAVRP